MVLMRRLSLALLVLALAAASASAGPTLAVETPDGEPAELVLRQGERALIVHFWATWCSGCIVELPVLAAARKRCRHRNVRIVEVNVGEEPSQVDRFIEDHGLEVQSWFDRDASTWRSLRAHGLPVTLTWTAAGQSLEVGPRNAVWWSNTLASVGCDGV